METHNPPKVTTIVKKIDEVLHDAENHQIIIRQLHLDFLNTTVRKKKKLIQRRLLDYLHKFYSDEETFDFFTELFDRTNNKYGVSDEETSHRIGLWRSFREDYNCLFSALKDWSDSGYYPSEWEHVDIFLKALWGEEGSFMNLMNLMNEYYGNRLEESVEIEYVEVELATAAVSFPDAVALSPGPAWHGISKDC